MENDPIIGTAGDDELRGTGGADVIRGLGGDDVLRGRGGAGDDTIVGGTGVDTVDYSDLGGDATVVIRLVESDAAGFAVTRIDRDGVDGLEEQDRLEVPGPDGRGVEVFRLGEGDDNFEGGEEDETVRLGGGNDGVNASPGEDVYAAGAGSDLLLYDVSRGGVFDPDDAGAVPKLKVGLELATVTVDGEVLSCDRFASFDVEAGEVDVFEEVAIDVLADSAMERAVLDASLGELPVPVGVRIDLREGRLDAIVVEAAGGFAAGDG